MTIETEFSVEVRETSHGTHTKAVDVSEPRETAWAERGEQPIHVTVASWTPYPSDTHGERAPTITFSVGSLKRAEWEKLKRIGDRAWADWDRAFGGKS